MSLGSEALAQGFVEIDLAVVSQAKSSATQGNTNLYSSVAGRGGLLLGFAGAQSRMAFVLGGGADFASFKALSVGGASLSETLPWGLCGFQLQLKRTEIRLRGGLRQVGLIIGGAAAALTVVTAPVAAGSLTWYALRGLGHDIYLKAEGEYFLPAGQSTRLTSGLALNGEVGIDFRFSGVPFAGFASYRFVNLSATTGTQAEGLLAFGLRIYIEAGLNAGGKPKVRHMLEN